MMRATPRPLSPIWLPLDALQLAGRFVLPLAFFYTAGRVVHDLILVVAVYVSDIEGPRKYLGFAIMSMAVLATLAAYVAMFRVVRPLAAVPGPDETGRNGRLVNAIAHTLLPFLIFYGAWGLFVEDVRRYSILAQELFGVEQIYNLVFEPAHMTFAIAAGAFLVRAALERFYRRSGNAALGLFTTVFEAMWMFFAVFTVGELIGAAAQWVTSRAAWVTATDAIGVLIPSLPPLGELIGTVMPDPRDALLMPLIWLIIAAVVYGHRMWREDTVIGWTARLPRPIGTAAEVLSRDLRDKYMPMLNGLRFVIRAGPLLFLTLCLCYVLLAVARDWAFIGVTRLAGPHEANWWTVWHDPISFGVDAVHEVLRISLLAAAFYLAVRRARDDLTAPAAGRSPGSGGA